MVRVLLQTHVGQFQTRPLLVEDEMTLPIQINGKRRDEILVSKNISKDELEVLVLKNKAVLKALGGATPKKLIVVPGRIVNVVI